MGWVVAAVWLAAYLYVRYAESKIQKPKPAEMDVSTANEGVEIPVLFGSATIANVNITWVGDKQILPNSIGTRDNSGNLIVNESSDKGAIIYTASLQLALCHGKIDDILDVYSSGRGCLSRKQSQADGSRSCFLANDRDTSRNTQWGGYAIVRHGAVNNAGIDEGVSDYLSRQMSLPAADGTLATGTPSNAVGPKYFGVATALLPGFAWGPSPFLAQLAFAAKRIHTRNGGDVQWYDAKAEIARPTRSRMDKWKYFVQAPTDPADYSHPTYDDSAWAQGVGGIGNAEVGYYAASDYGGTRPLPYVGTKLPGSVNVGTAPNYFVKADTSLWLRWDLGALPVYPLTVQAWHSDSPKLWFNGHVIPLVATTDEQDPQVPRYNSTAVIPKEYINEAGPNVIALKSQVILASQAKYIYAGLQTGNNSEFPAGVADINPAHVVHEVLTDKLWGMGYNDADLDDTAFRTAADALFAEGLGMSFVWSQQMTVEDCLNDIMRHISGVLYRDRSTRLFVLKLLRDDYVIEDLVTLDEFSISKVDDVVRKQPGELVNTVTVTYTGTMLGAQSSLTVYDEGVMAMQGGAVSAKVDYPAITSSVNASKLAIRDLRLLSSPLLSCKVTANRLAAALNIGDPFILNWPDLGIVNEVMRVTEIDIGDGIDNAVKVTCVEDLFFFPKDAMYVPSDPVATPKVNNPGQLVSDTYTTWLALDQRNKGPVACCFIGAHAPGANTPIFEGGWIEGPTGTMTRGTAGPLPSDWFDGVDPGTDDHSGVSPMLGALVLVYTPDTISHPSITGYDEKHTGLYILDDVGGHWENYDDVPHRAFVSTYAKMHRAPDYIQNAAFVKDMIFQVNAGTAYGGRYIQYNTANAVLGNTPLAWSDIGTAVPWSNDYVLLKGDQIKSKVLSPDSTLTVTGTGGSGGYTGPGFPAIKPGKAWSTPAGDWSVQLSSVEVSGASAGSVTTAGVQIYADHDLTGEMLFEMQSSALQNGMNRPSAMHYSAPQLSFAATDGIVLLLTMHTTSTTPVTMTRTFNGGNAITLKIPSRVIPIAKPAPIGFTTAVLGS